MSKINGIPPVPRIPEINAEAIWNNIKQEQKSLNISRKFMSLLSEFQIELICSRFYYQIFAALLPQIYQRMLNHIVICKEQQQQQTEKIEIKMGLFNELTSRQKYCFESKLIKKKLMEGTPKFLKPEPKSEKDTSEKAFQNSYFRSSSIHHIMCLLFSILIL